MEPVLELNTPESQADSGILDAHDQAASKQPPRMVVRLPKRFKLQRQKSVSCPHLDSGSNIAYFPSSASSLCSDKCFSRPATASSVIGFIDDEIPDYASLFLGNYVSFTGLLNTEKPMTYSEMKFIDHRDPEDGSEETSTEARPEKCFVYGAGVYYGQVGFKNHFMVDSVFVKTKIFNLICI